MFDGKIFDAQRDGHRLRNNTQRVFAHMLDGGWHGKADLEPVGGAAYDSRLRDLRKSKFGGFIIEEGRDPTTDGTMSRYRLDLSSVTEAKAQAILLWTAQTSKEEQGLKRDKASIRRAVKVMDRKQCQKVLDLIRTFELTAQVPVGEPDVAVYELWGDDAD